MENKMKLLQYIHSALILSVLMLVGCGGSGGGGDINIADIRATLCPGYKYQENGGRQEIIFASINRANITGWIENSLGNKVGGSDLVTNSQANTSEITLSTSLVGSYKLVYYVNSEKFEFARDVQWTTIPDFTTAPQPPVWNSASRQLSVSYSATSAGVANYYLRLFYAALPDRMYQQTSTSPGGGVLSMHVNQSDIYTPVLVAEAVEGDRVSSVIHYIFSAMPLN